VHILVTGGTGFIGSALLPALRAASHTVTVLSRSPRADSDGLSYVSALEAVAAPVGAVINLAGASLADRRWSASYKRELRDSRIGTTEALGAWLATQDRAPDVMLSASAIGYYGAGGDEPFDEERGPGQGFAAQLCRDWEQAAHGAAPAQTRLCLLRLGVVFDRDGGAYEQMARPFRLRFGNWIGDGGQWLSWVHRHDVVAAMLFLLERGDVDGAVNITAPEPVTSRGFCAAMQSVHRSVLSMPVPAAVMRLALGEMADELLISGQRVEPRRLLSAGFQFRYPALEEALPELEKRTAA
jgi:uncharacterized protein (TIGR01777 family)